MKAIVTTLERFARFMVVNSCVTCVDFDSVHLISN